MYIFNFYDSMAMISFKGYFSIAEIHYYEWKLIFVDTIYLQLSLIEKKFQASYNGFKSVESSFIIARVVFESVSGFLR